MKKIGWFVVVMGHSKVVGNVTIRWSAQDFLFNFNRDYLSILCRFRDMASYWSKVADFHLPHLHFFDAFIVVEPVVISPRSFFIVWRYLRDLVFRGFYAIPACD